MQGNTTISVVKSVATEAYDAPAIVYELICGADAPMSVRLREPIPTGFEAVDLGFHQEHHADEWWVGDDEIVFEYPFEPGETVTTVVGVRTSAPDDLDSFLSEPTIEVATTDHDGSQCWGDVTDSLVDVRTDPDAIGERVAATDGGEVPLASDDGDSNESPQSADSDADRIEAAIPSVEAAGGDDEQPDTGWPVETDNEVLVDRFVDELASDSLSQSQRQRLQAALGVDGVSSMDARIEHCQQRLSDLSAYVEALETFLDEEGGGQELIAGFRDDVAAVESHLASLETDLDETTSGQQDLRDRIETVEDEVASLRSLRDDVAAMEAEVDEATTEIRAEVESLSKTVDRLQEWQRGVTSAFDDLGTGDA